MRNEESKVIIVTGAGSGIGRAVVLRLALQGAQVAGFDLSAEGLTETQALLPMGATFLPVRCDVTHAAQVTAGIATVVERWGHINGLFNGAGASGRRHGDGPVDQCSEAGWDWTLNVNLRSVFLMCKHCVPHVLASRGAIVNLASVLGMVGGDEDFATHAYASAKAGIIGLSRAMASTYASRGLRVNVVAPGLIATPMSQRAQQSAHIQERLAQLQPLTGSMGLPDDVAAAVSFLLSEDARFLTGVVLPVDGGWTVR